MRSPDQPRTPGVQPARDPRWFSENRGTAKIFDNTRSVTDFVVGPSSPAAITTMTNLGDAGLGMHVITTKTFCLTPETSLRPRFRLANARRLSVPIPIVRQSFGLSVRSTAFVPQNKDAA